MMCVSSFTLNVVPRNTCITVKVGLIDLHITDKQTTSN